jgi:hypothetical protein
MEYRIDKLRPGARYVFQIRSYNEEETSDWSPAFYVTIPSDTSIPANVGTVTATYTNQSFKFTWPDVTTNADASPAYDIKNYEVTISDGTNSYTATTSDNEYIVTSDDFLSRLGVGDNVSISVIAVDLSGNESATPSTANVSAPSPSDVTGFTATGSVGAIRLAWNRVTNVAIKEYEIYAGDTSGFTPDTATFTNRIAVTNNDSFVWTSGSGGTDTKYFKIRAVSIHNEYSVNFVLANSSTVDVTVDGLVVQDENANVSTDVTQIDFQGAGVTVTSGTGEVIVTIPGGSGSALEIFDEGSSLTAAAESINFTGSAVVATNSGVDVTVDIDNIIEYEFSYTGLVNSTYSGTHRRYVSKAGTLLEVRTGLGVAPTTSSVICDINKNGTTIFTTQGNRPTITTSNFTSGAVTNMDVTSLAAGDYLTVDIDQGDAGAAKDLTVYVRIRET